ncbi:hypothetical protein ABIA95_000176 [Bradyrhizobium sp. LA8.1]|uniref:head-tail adaptor protein n=1 Tax=unclassified Bradyrhizobium TaxID=2631580 RepID=UPI0033943400
MTRAGELRHRIGFFKRHETDDSMGNVETSFPDDPEFEVFGKVSAKFGGETVLAQRLQGHQVYTLTVRQNSKTENIDPSWMAKDMNEDTVWAIQSGPVDPDDSGAFYEFLCQTGVAA